MASGPTTTRFKGNTAALPELTGGVTSGLMSFLQGQGTGPFSNQPSALQQQLTNVFANQLNQPSAAQRTFDMANPFITSLLQNTPGQGVLDAATPIFQRNLQLGADTLRQAGPRFNSNTERLIANQGNHAMQDFNLFSQQVMQEGLNQQLQGLGIFGNLGSNADASNLNLLNSAGNFANTMQGQNQNFNQFLLGLATNAGIGQPVFQQNPGWFNQATQGLSSIAQLIGAWKGGNPGTPSSVAQGGSFSPTAAFQPPQFGSSTAANWWNGRP